MPLPLAPLLPVVLRLGAIAGAGWALARWARAQGFPGRTDQRAEDALDDLGEGLSSHRPADRATDGASQRNLTARARRVIRFRGTVWEVDAGLIARLRLRRRGEPE